MTDEVVAERPRLRSALRALGVVGLSSAFIAATGLGVALHADLPVGRRLAARYTERLLSSVLRGTAHLGAFSHIGLTQVTIARATLDDEYSHPVLTLSDVRLDFSLKALAYELLFGHGRAAVFVDDVRVERSDVELLADPVTGEPTIVEALSPKKATDARPSSRDGGASVVLRRVELGVVRLHVRLPNQPPLDARLRRVSGELTASPDGLAVDVQRFGVVLRGKGLTARGTGTISIRAPGAVQGSFQGFFGDVEFRTSGKFERGHLDLVADVPRARADAVERLLPTWPLHGTVSAHAEAHGAFPTLDTLATLHAGSSLIAAEGSVKLSDPPSATLEVNAHHVDARLFLLAAPSTDVDVGGTIALRGPLDRPSAEVHARIAETVVSGRQFPATHVDGKLESGNVSGTFGTDDPKLPVTGSFHVEKTGALDVDAKTSGVVLDRAVPDSPLHGTARGRVTLHVANGTARATVDADVALAALTGVVAKQTHVTLQASAPVDAPSRFTGSAHLASSGVRVAGVDANSLVIDAHGGKNGVSFTARASLAQGPETLASGVLSLSGRPVLKDTKISFRQDPVTIEGTIASLDIPERRVDIRDVHVTGAGGRLTGSVRLGPHLVEVEAKGEDVNLDTLSRALGLQRGTLEGKARIDASLVTGQNGTRGRVRLGLGNATIFSAAGLSVDATADLDGKKLTGSVSGLAAGLATFGATWNTELAGSALAPASYRDLTGTADVQIGDVRLGLLGALLPKKSPVALTDGRLYAHLLLDRKTSHAKVPNVFATVSTRGLVLDVPKDSASSKVRVAGIDLTATGALDGTTGDATGTALAADAHGALFTTTAAVHTEIPHFIRDPLQALGELLDTPIDVVVSAPRRKVQDLPDILRPDGVLGTVSGTASVRGSLRHPALFASVDGAGIAADGTPLARLVDLHADAAYEWNTRALTLRTTASVAGRAVATGTFRGAIPGAPSSWAGTGRLDLTALPVDLIFPLVKSQASGALDGTLTLTRDGTSGTLGGDVVIENAVVDHTALGEGNLHVETAGDVVRAKLGFTGGDGTLDATASLPISFGGVFPELGHDAPVEARVVAHDFVAIAFTPLVSGVLTRLGGRFDADAQLRFSPSGGNGWTGGVQGTATLHDGNVLIDALGLEVKDVGASVEAHGTNGETAVSIRDVHGSVRSSKDNLQGAADLVLEGVKVVRGTATLQANDMPILLGGAPQGRITGQANARLTRETDRMLVDVDLPSMIVALPQSSARQVIPLGDNPDVSVLQMEQSVSTREVTPWRLALHLGSNVFLRRSDVELALTGTPSVDLGETADVGGAVEISPGGRVPVMGKVFIVERGRVVFDTGDSSNPRLAVSATWRAPDDTIVYVEVTGTLQAAQIALRSDPPLPEAEVFALILGGTNPDTTDANTDPATESNGAAAGAVALGGGVAALGLNQLLSNNPVEVRVDTTSQSLPRYTAAVRVRPNLWFEASEYQQATFGPGAADRNVFSGVVDYRFTHRWSLRTEAGTIGGALDLLWQYSY